MTQTFRVTKRLFAVTGTREREDCSHERRGKFAVSVGALIFCRRLWMDWVSQRNATVVHSDATLDPHELQPKLRNPRFVQY